MNYFLVSNNHIVTISCFAPKSFPHYLFNTVWLVLFVANSPMYVYFIMCNYLLSNKKEILLEFLIWVKKVILLFPHQQMKKRFLTQEAGKEIFLLFHCISLKLLRPYATLKILIGNQSALVNLTITFSKTFSYKLLTRFELHCTKNEVFH